jgi:hypothetical protein
VYLSFSLCSRRLLENNLGLVYGFCGETEHPKLDGTHLYFDQGLAVHGHRDPREQAPRCEKYAHLPKLNEWTQKYKIQQKQDFTDGLARSGFWQAGTKNLHPTPYPSSQSVPHWVVQSYASSKFISYWFIFTCLSGMVKFYNQLWSSPPPCFFVVVVVVVVLGLELGLHLEPLHQRIFSKGLF